MKKALVTGGTGFVGANLVRRLLCDGHEVHLMVRSNHQSWRIDDCYQDVSLHEVPLDDADAVLRMMKSIRPDWIFHLAAHGAYSWQTDMNAIIRTNVNGLVNLIQAAAKSDVGVLVNTGSSSEYGFKSFPPTEDTWVEPNSIYAVAKVAATHFCRLLAMQYKMHIPTLRLYSVYGPYEEPKRLIPAVILNGLRGQYPPLVSPDIARDYVYVDDVMDACLLAANKIGSEFGPIYNVGSGIQTSLKDVIHVAKEQLAIQTEPQWGSMPDRLWDSNVWVSNPEKIKAELGWGARHSFAEGFTKSVEWFKCTTLVDSHYAPVLFDQMTV
jgi:nucleoside-diphosphate-sugar epimerase